jgi:hypothetical protein
MLPKSAIPAALPLSREAALNLLDRLDDFAATGGTFLTFVRIRTRETFSGVAWHSSFPQQPHHLVQLERPELAL